MSASKYWIVACTWQRSIGSDAACRSSIKLALRNALWHKQPCAVQPKRAMQCGTHAHAYAQHSHMSGQSAACSMLVEGCTPLRSAAEAMELGWPESEAFWIAAIYCCAAAV